MQEVEQDEDNDEVKRLEDTYLVRPSSLPAKSSRWNSSWAHVLLPGIVIGVALMATLQMAWLAIRKRRAPSQRAWESPAEVGYVPMAVIEEAPEEETLLTPQQREGPQ
jgi:hypothetical protein